VRNLDPAMKKPRAPKIDTRNRAYGLQSVGRRGRWHATSLTRQLTFILTEVSASADTYIRDTPC